MRRVVRIERKDDRDTVSNKSFDFSSDTIQHLIEKGYKEARVQIEIESKVQSLIDKIIDLQENENIIKKGKIDLDNITLLERKLLSIKAIYLKEEHEPIITVLKYLEEIINKIDKHLPANREVATLLIDELTKFHESLKNMRV